MGRKKIKIERIEAPQKRQITFNKRKLGVMKKAMELSILCEANVTLVIFCQGKLYQYASKDMKEMMEHYDNYVGQYESFTNEDFDSLSQGRYTSRKALASKIRNKRSPGPTCNTHNTRIPLNQTGSSVAPGGDLLLKRNFHVNKILIPKQPSDASKVTMVGGDTQNQDIPDGDVLNSLISLASSPPLREMVVKKENELQNSQTTLQHMRNQQIQILKDHDEQESMAKANIDHLSSVALTAAEPIKSHHTKASSTIQPPVHALSSSTPTLVSTFPLDGCVQREAQVQAQVQARAIATLSNTASGSTAASVSPAASASASPFASAAALATALALARENSLTLGRTGVGTSKEAAAGGTFNMEARQTLKRKHDRIS